MPPLLAINQVWTKVNPLGRCNPHWCAISHWHATPPACRPNIVHGDGNSEVPWPLGPQIYKSLVWMLAILPNCGGVFLNKREPVCDRAVCHPEWARSLITLDSKNWAVFLKDLNQKLHKSGLIEFFYFSLCWVSVMFFFFFFFYVFRWTRQSNVRQR